MIRMPGDGNDPNDPFSMPFLADLFRMLQSKGPVSWDAARQFAASVATEGASEPNVDPTVRIKLEQLARVAELHVQNATGLSTDVDGRPAVIAPVNRSGWVNGSIDAWRPVIERMASSIAQASQLGLQQADEHDPTAAILGPMLKALNPMLIGLTAGSMVGHLATRALGMYDVPLPRRTNEVMIVVPNIASFADDWSLDRDDLGLWVCLSELCHHAVLNVPAVRDRLNGLLLQHASAFTANEELMHERFSSLDLAALLQGGGDEEAMAELQKSLGDPDLVLGVVQSPAQRALLPQLEAVICAIVGYVDHVMDNVGPGLIRSHHMLTEALRRRRVESTASDRFVERILGLNLTQAQYDRAKRFVDGVIERSDPGALGQLWSRPLGLPTPAEIDAPGLWLARLEAFD